MIKETQNHVEEWWEIYNALRKQALLHEFLFKGDQSMTKIEFDAVPSGDGKGFCYNVDAKTFETVCDEKPTMGDRTNRWNKNIFRLYPDQIARHDVFKHHITIERKPDGLNVITIEEIGF